MLHDIHPRSREHVSVLIMWQTNKIFVNASGAHDMVRVSLGQTQMRRCVPATTVLEQEELDNELDALADVDDLWRSFSSLVQALSKSFSMSATARLPFDLDDEIRVDELDNSPPSTNGLDNLP
jgi:hypothetical protein